MVQKYRQKKGFALSMKQKIKAEDFIAEIFQNPEGISADREKFIHGMETNSHKVLPPNKSE